MITRKRARVGSQAETNHTTWSLEVDTSEEIEVVDGVHTSPFPYSSPESEETSGLDLDLFNINDFNWQLDNYTLPLLFDEGGSGLQDRSRSTSQSSYRVRDSLANSPHGAVQLPACNNNVSVQINKNAIAARMNRLRKKEYVNGLENKVTSLAAENLKLRQVNEHLNKRVDDLEDEARYLRAVLANESTLGQLLSRLSGVNGMKVSTSLFQEPNKSDHDYALPRKRVKIEENETSGGGVCLHVDKDHVSVEFCTKCAESASTALKMWLICHAGYGLQNIPDFMTPCGFCWGMLKKRDQRPPSWPGICLKQALCLQTFYSPQNGLSGNGFSSSDTQRNEDCLNTFKGRPVYMAYYFVNALNYESVFKTT